MLNITQKMLILANSDKTVFSTADLSLMWKIKDRNILYITIHRAIEKKYLETIKRGIYKLKEKKINTFELACKMKKNAYISFETVLTQADIINQWYNEIFLASNRNISIKNKYNKFIYKKLPNKIMANRLGIIKKDEYFIASPERALCDKIYKDGLVYFDDLSTINCELTLEISKIYNKRVIKDIKKICA